MNALANISAVGAVIIQDKLTFAIRRGNIIERPVNIKINTPLDAAAKLIFVRRNSQAIIYLESSGVAGQVLKYIREKFSASPDEVVNGQASARSLLEGVRFYNRRSELHFLFRQKVENGELLLPAEYANEIVAFAQSENDGKIYFESPEDVASKLGAYPALAVAAVLAAIESPHRARLKTGPRGHHPYKNF